MAVNVAVLKKVAVDLARSGREGLQESYKVGGGFPPPPHPLQYHWPLEGVGPETHVHKITNVPVFLHGTWT
jgi:hypothetical protein